MAQRNVCGCETLSRMTRTRKVLLAVAAAAGIGLLVFGALVYRAVNIERASVPEALRRFEAVRSAFGGRTALLTLDESGSVIRREEPARQAPGAIRRLNALAFQADQQRLIAANVPFWFFKIKGPAAQLALRDTGLDLGQLRITAADLERHGPALVIDRLRANGDRLLVWTE